MEINPNFEAVEKAPRIVTLSSGEGSGFKSLSDGREILRPSTGSPPFHPGHAGLRMTKKMLCKNLILF
jgi:hypothetical protein